MGLGANFDTITQLRAKINRSGMLSLKFIFGNNWIDR